jgi:hypothetical protein
MCAAALVLYTPICRDEVCFVDSIMVTCVPVTSVCTQW